MTPFQRLLHRYAATSHEKQRAFERGDLEPAEYDPDTGSLTLGERSFDVQRLATVDKSGQWRWAWADPEAHPAHVLRAATRIQRRGVDLDCDALCTPTPSGTVTNVQLALVACGLGDGAACYTLKTEQASAVFLIKDPTEVPDTPSAAELVQTFESLLTLTRLENHQQALIDYWSQRKVSTGPSDDGVYGMTADANMLFAAFNSQGRLTSLELRRDPPASGFPLGHLQWTGDEASAKVVLGAVDVAALGRLVSSRTLTGRSFSLRGARGQMLIVRPRRRPGFTVGEKTFELWLNPAQAQGLLATLRPKCAEYPLPDALSSLCIEVVVSEVKDADGKVLREIGWDPVPDPEWALDPDEFAAAQETRNARRARRRRFLLGSVPAAVLLSPVFLVLFASYYLRHVPYEIPDAYRAPPPGIGLALGAGLRLRYLGISGYELTDGKTVVLLDPTLTRPELKDLLTGPVDSDPALLGAIRSANYILVNHAHHDHAMDVPAIAKRTGAIVLGSQSVINLCLARGVPAKQTRLAVPGERVQLGTFTVDVRTTSHSDVLGIANPMSGLIPPDAGPLWFFDYANDEMRVYRLAANGASVWFHPSSTFAPGELEGEPAGTLIMGVTGQDLTAGIVGGVLEATQPRWVIPTHYDNFFQPASKGLALMPVIDLDDSVALFKTAHPQLKVYVLDYGQEIELPGD